MKAIDRHDWKSALPKKPPWLGTQNRMRPSAIFAPLASLLLIVMAAGTAGYHYIEGWPWFDGFYMVVTTLTTIGYQEVHPLSQAGRVFNVCCHSCPACRCWLGDRDR